MSEAVERRQDTVPGWLALMSERRSNFALDRRFSPDATIQANARVTSLAEQEAAGAAEMQRAVNDAFAAGLARGREEGEAILAAETAANRSLSLSITRLDETLRRAFADRLAQTVAALCEATLAPLALDGDALQRRCSDAADLLGEVQERLELHLHPDDLVSLDPDFAAGWRIVVRPDFARGTVRVEGGEAGAVDGPVQWRAALEAAFAC